MEWLSFAPITAWTALEGAPFAHRHLNRNTAFSDNYSFDEMLEEEPVETHVDIGTGPRSPVAETVLKELEVEESIGVDKTDYMHKASSCGHSYEKPVYGEDGEGTFLKAEGTELPLQKDSTDLVTMGRYLNNIEPEKRGEALEEVQRVLRPGGKAIGDIKVTRFVRPHQMLQERTLGTKEILGRAARSRYRKMWEEKLNEYFEEVETETAWIDEEERPYVQTIKFSAENPENY